SLINGYLLFEDEQYLNEFRANAEHSKEIFERAQATGNSESLNNLLEEKLEWEKGIEQAITDFKEGDKEKAIEYMKTTSAPLGNKLTENFSQLASERESSIEALGDSVQKNNDQIIILGISISS